MSTGGVPAAAIHVRGQSLHPWPRHVLAVCAHPDDESFGLGGIIATLVDRGTRTDLVCLTRGEASTLGAAAGLAERRDRELRCAARALGIEQLTALDHPDGGLSGVPLGDLATAVRDAVDGADLVLTFDEGGITGHPDHQRATQVAMTVAGELGIPVVAWAVPEDVADSLARELGITVVGRDVDREVDVVLHVDRARQRRAIACHGSQLADNPVPRRRIELQGDREHLRWLSRPA